MDRQIEQIEQMDRVFTCPNSSFKLEVLANAGVSLSSWYISISWLMKQACPNLTISTDTYNEMGIKLLYKMMNVMKARADPDAELESNCKYHASSLVFCCYCYCYIYIILYYVIKGGKALQSINISVSLPLSRCIIVD